MVLEKVPVPVPFEVLVLKELVGFGLVLQHTPRLMILPPPSFEMVPPLTAEFSIISEAAVVLRVGKLKLAVVKLT
jgi:hypothetical protein